MAGRPQQLTSVRGLLPLLTSARQVAPTNQSELALKISGQRGDRTGAQVPMRAFAMLTWALRPSWAPGHLGRDPLLGLYHDFHEPLHP